MTHLRVLITNYGDTFAEPALAEARAWARPGTTVDVVSLSRGPASIESEYDEVLAGPPILERIAEAIADGVDGVFLDCFGDPAVHACREFADFPVVGGFEPAVYTAMTLGERIGIVTVLPNVLPMLRSLAKRYGIADRIGVIDYVNLPVLELHDRDTMLDRLYEQASAMVRRGDADVIVLGCTGMMGVAGKLQDMLAADGAFVPVIDPTGAAIGWLENAVHLRVRPSRVTYMPPPDKVRAF